MIIIKERKILMICVLTMSHELNDSGQKRYNLLWWLLLWCPDYNSSLGTPLLGCRQQPWSLISPRRRVLQLL